MNCERQTLIFFLLGSAAMLACVYFLPRYLGSGALCVGMACDFCITAICSLVLLRKKAGKLQSGKYFIKLVLAMLPVLAIGILLHNLLMRCVSYVIALVLTIFVMLVAEILVLSLFKLMDFRALIARFFAKKHKKSLARS